MVVALSAVGCVGAAVELGRDCCNIAVVALSAVRCVGAVVELGRDCGKIVVVALSAMPCVGIDSLVVVGLDE